MSESEITNCTEALRLLAAYLDDEVGEHLHAEMDRHLEMCRSCSSRAEFETRLKEDIAELAAEPVPPELSNRIQTLIRQFTNVSGT